MLTRRTRRKSLVYLPKRQVGTNSGSAGFNMSESARRPALMLYLVGRNATHTRTDSLLSTCLIPLSLLASTRDGIQTELGRINSLKGLALSGQGGPVHGHGSDRKSGIARPHSGDELKDLLVIFDRVKYN
jgi:hypothetical protein